MYNLIEYSDNYADATASLYQYKRPEQPLKNQRNITDVSAANSSSFKYKSNLLKGLVAKNINAGNNPDIVGAHRMWLNAQIAVSLKYISIFFRLLKLPLINTKLYIELNWSKNSVTSCVVGNTSFQVTKTELYGPVVTLNTNNNKKLNGLLRKGFKR